MTKRSTVALVFRGAAVIAALVPLFTAASCYAAPQAAAPAPQAAAQPAKRIALAGVPNFGQVTPTLYRGGQPYPEGYVQLKELGIEVVVNFRNEPEEIETERRAVEALGLGYISIPWSGRHNPTSEQVADFLTLLRDNPRKKIFAHCHHGADRTGVMIAAYRIALQNWTPPEARAEMEAFHYHHFWLPHLQKYVEGFPQRLAGDPRLRALQPVAPPASP